MYIADEIIGLTIAVIVGLLWFVIRMHQTSEWRSNKEEKAHIKVGNGISRSENDNLR